MVVEEEGCFGFGGDGYWWRCDGVGVGHVRKFVSVVEGEEDVSEGEIEGVGAESLAGSGGYCPF